MTLEEALRRTDEDEELWFASTTNLESDFITAFQRDGIRHLTRNGEARQPFKCDAWTDEEAREILLPDGWSLVRIQDGRWERVP